jgi:hypothetical protein
MLRAVIRQTAGETTLVESSRPPQAHLHHGDLDPGLREREETHSGQDVENREGRIRRDLRPEALKEMNHGRRGDGLPVDADALPHGVEMGGGVEAGAVAGGPQDGLHHCGRGALALGARDVDHGVAPVGVAQPLQQASDRLQAESLREPGPAGLEIRPAEELGQDLRVGGLDVTHNLLLPSGTERSGRANPGLMEKPQSAQRLRRRICRFNPGA